MKVADNTNPSQNCTYADAGPQGHSIASQPQTYFYQQVRPCASRLSSDSFAPDSLQVSERQKIRTTEDGTISHAIVQEALQPPKTGIDDRNFVTKLFQQYGVEEGISKTLHFMDSTASPERRKRMERLKAAAKLPKGLQEESQAEAADTTFRQHENFLYVLTCLRSVKVDPDFLFSESGVIEAADDKNLIKLANHLRSLPSRKKGQDLNAYADRIESFYLQMIKSMGALSLVSSQKINAFTFGLMTTTVDDAGLHTIKQELKKASKLSLYPYYLALICIEGSDSYLKDAARAFLQTDCDLENATSLTWGEEISVLFTVKDEKNFIPTNTDDTQQECPRVRTTSIKSANKNRCEDAELRRLQFLGATFEHVVIAKRLICDRDAYGTEQNIQKSYARGAALLKLPARLITDIEAQLAFWDCHRLDPSDPLWDQCAQQSKALPTILAEVAKIDTLSKINGDRYGELSCFLRHDTILRSLNKQFEELTAITQMQQKITTFKQVDQDLILFVQDMRRRCDLLTRYKECQDQPLAKTFDKEAVESRNLSDEAKKIPIDTTPDQLDFSVFAIFEEKALRLHELKKRVESLTPLARIEQELAAQTAFDSLMADTSKSLRDVKPNPSSSKKKRRVTDIDAVVARTKDALTAIPAESGTRIELHSALRSPVLKDMHISKLVLPPTVALPPSIPSITAKVCAIQPGEVLQRFKSILHSCEKGRVWRPEIGGFRLTTRLTPMSTLLLLDFMCPASFDRNVKQIVGDLYLPNYSGRAYSLDYHLKKHFSLEGKIGEAGEVETKPLEDYLLEALELCAAPEAVGHVVTSSTDRSQKLYKKFYKSFFGIYDQYHQVVTFGVAQLR